MTLPNQFVRRPPAGRPTPRSKRTGTDRFRCQDLGMTLPLLFLSGAGLHGCGTTYDAACRSIRAWRTARADE